MFNNVIYVCACGDFAFPPRGRRTNARRYFGLSADELNTIKSTEQETECVSYEYFPRPPLPTLMPNSDPEESALYSNVNYSSGKERERCNNHYFLTHFSGARKLKSQIKVLRAEPLPSEERD